GVLGVQKKLSPDQSWFSPNTQNQDQLRQNSVLDHIKKMQEVIKKNELEEKVNITQGDGEIFIELKDSMLFDSGSAILKPNYFKLLSVISKMLFKDAKEIRVEGHTDDIPIRTRKYPSNWELSVDRALSVVKYFVKKEGVSPDRLVVAGLGEFRPIVPNNSPKNRAKNRRVIINVKF
ncbi:MAG: flagellar motor protein MotB, partial [bacterium]